MKRNSATKSVKRNEGNSIPHDFIVNLLSMGPKDEVSMCDLVDKSTGSFYFQLKAIFLAMDSNHDGYLSDSEFSSALELLGLFPRAKLVEKYRNFTKTINTRIFIF